jgi:hypothetical protein
MTRAEYEEVCKKFPDYLNLTGSGSCYIKGAITMGIFQVTDIAYEDRIVDFNNVIGKIWYKCYYSTIQKNIQTKPRFCYYAKTKEEFEKKIQEFIENYKRVKVKVKQINLKKDFE